MNSKLELFALQCLSLRSIVSHSVHSTSILFCFLYIYMFSLTHTHFHIFPSVELLLLFC
jgi:hypothetical protein